MAPVDYRDYDVENGHSSTPNYPPSEIHHPSRQQHQHQQHQQFQKLPPTPEDTDNSTQTSGGKRRGSHRSHSGGGLMKHFNKLFRKGHKGGKEQIGLLQQQQQGLKSAGTFETQKSQYSNSHSNSSNTSEHPRSQNNMNKKWGTIKQQMDPNQWMRSLESARVMGVNPEDGSIMSREEMLQNAQDRIRSLNNFSKWHCLAAVLIYVSISVGLFSYWLQHWSIVDSVYFAVVTFTTIGYGDVVPDTRMARLFTCGWALSGVACLGIALGMLGSELIDVAEQDKETAKEKQKAEMMDMFNGEEGSSSSALKSGASQYSDLGYNGVEDNGDNDDEAKPTCCQALISVKMQRFVLLSAFLVTTLHFICVNEGWTLWSTVYYGIITASTVGYGDLSPQTEAGRILAILYIPIAVGLMGTFLDLVATSIIAQKTKSAEDYWGNHDLSLKDLRVMDSDGDGTVSKAEFLEFMLVAMDQVDQDTLDNLKDHFDRLDKDKSGALDKGDLIEMAQTKLDSQKNLKQSKRR